LVWGFIGLAGLCQAVYMISLAGAYRHGDISIAYPVVRSSPILVVMIVVFILGRGDQVSWLSIAGTLLVVLGSVVLPMKHFADLRVANYLNPSCLLGLLAACATAGYSLIDDEALRHLQSLPELGRGAVEVTLLYALMEGLSSCLWLGLIVLVKSEGRAAFTHVVRARLRPAALTGIGMYITYPLVLISMAFVDNVSYVVAFRQVSIPIGVGLGILLLNEPRYVPKFAGTALIFVGLVLVGTG
jgi:drug/metabolite transporter (DMT)-like permease